MTYDIPLIFDVQTNRQKSGCNEGWFLSNAGARKIPIVEEEWLAQAKEVHDDMKAALSALLGQNGLA